MNFVFVSPQFPETYANFCERLAERGVTVLGIGDAPYDGLPQALRDALTEYWYAPSLEDYDQVFRACAYFSYKYGKIDWIESNNEYWLSLDAQLRTDFNVTTGANAQTMAAWQSKAAMKPLYAAGGVPSARQVPVTTIEAAADFVDRVGVAFAKPEYGMGAAGTMKVETWEDLETLFAEKGDSPYVLEEFVPASEICAYDAILDSDSEPLFENEEEFPPSMSEVAQKQIDLAYWCRPDVEEELRQMGRATAKAFGIKSRFVHMEFFRLAEDKPGLGKKGGFVGLEVNCRPAGGYTTELMNYAHSTDVYTIWADMVCHDQLLRSVDETSWFCVDAGRRNVHSYVHDHDDIVRTWGDRIVMMRPIPQALSDDLGDFMYVARVATEDERKAFVDYVQEQR